MYHVDSFSPHPKKQKRKENPACVIFGLERQFTLYDELHPRKAMLLLIGIYQELDRLRGVVVRVPGYRSVVPASIPGATIFSEK
jgi:hypothetical protein